MNDQKLTENIDFYYDSTGLMVLTKDFLIKRGYCCQSGCLHCPYDYHDKVDPNVPAELQDPWQTRKQCNDTFDPDED